MPGIFSAQILRFDFPSTCTFCSPTLIFTWPPSLGCPGRELNHPFPLLHSPFEVSAVQRRFVEQLCAEAQAFSFHTTLLASLLRTVPLPLPLFLDFLCLSGYPAQFAQSSIVNISQHVCPACLAEILCPLLVTYKPFFLPISRWNKTALSGTAWLLHPIWFLLSRGARESALNIWGSCDGAPAESWPGSLQHIAPRRKVLQSPSLYGLYLRAGLCFLLGSRLKHNCRAPSLAAVLRACRSCTHMDVCRLFPFPAPA